MISLPLCRSLLRINDHTYPHLYNATLLHFPYYPYSRSRIFLTSFVGKDAVGLNRPGVEMDRAAEEEGVAGPFGVGGDAATAVAARISSPEGRHHNR